MKILKYTGLAFFLLFLSSCDKDFLETAPTDQVITPTTFTSLDNAYAAVNGIHRYLYYSHPDDDSQDEFGQGSMMLRMDVLGEDLCMTSAGNGWFNSMYKWQDHRNSATSGDLYPWKLYYRVILNANLILEGLQKNLSAQKDEPMYKYITAQALTYRAWAHFNLVQLYAKRYDFTKRGSNTQDGVILMLNSTIKAQPRASVEKVYEQINLDLNDAISLFDAIKNENMSGQISDFSFTAAQAIKARVALTTGDWDGAVKSSTSAMAGHALFKAADFTLNGGFPIAFSSYPGEGSEWIWGYQCKTNQTTGFASFFAYLSWNFNSSNIRSNPKTITKELYDVIPATDVRKGMFSSTGYEFLNLPTSKYVQNAMVASYASKKFMAYSTGESSADLAYIRVAEMYLIKAEAQYRLGLESDAKNTLKDLVSTRDDKYVLSKNAGEDLLNEILMQRRIELWGEGFRFLDLKRLDLPLKRITSTVKDPAAPYTSDRHVVTSYAGHHNPSLCSTEEVPAGDNKWQWLIPISEINSNSGIKQND